jgi:hypothetical protein
MLSKLGSHARALSDSVLINFERYKEPQSIKKFIKKARVSGLFL